MPDDARAGMPVPLLRNAALLPPTCEQTPQCRPQCFGIAADELVCADGHRFWPLSRIPCGHARYAHDGRLFGHPARIGDHAPGMPDQIVEFQVGLWRNRNEVRYWPPDFRKCLGSARMYG